MFYLIVKEFYYKDGTLRYKEGYKIKPSKGNTWKVCHVKQTMWSEIYTKTLVDGITYEECITYIKNLEEI